MASDIADRIRKLIAHEKSARSIGNFAEAEAFAAKVQQLLFEHKLSMSDVEVKADPFGNETASMGAPKQRAVPWSTCLAIAVCGATFCSVIEVKNSSLLIFVGRSVDRTIAIAMWRFPHDVAVGFAKKDVPKIAVLRRNMSPAKIRNKFLIGFSFAIQIRLAKDNGVPAGTDVNRAAALIVAERALLIDYRNAAFPRLRQVALEVPRKSLAFRAGFARGMTSPLRKQESLGDGQKGGR